ncbi:MAG TPA: hypothetical protein VJV78_12705 [Polyangiales bacterium]|nr:hypothetical protein [Polyangiales bacterium]
MKRALFLSILAGACICSARGGAQDAEAPEAPESRPAAVETPPEVVDPPPAAASEAVAEATPMTTEELAALGLDASAPVVNPDLEVSGFADASFGTLVAPENSYWRASGSVPAHSSFFVGNFNLIVHKDLTSSLSTTGEVRFTYLPNGSSLYGIEAREDTSSQDYVDFGRVTRWGGIIVQRIYLDWTPHPLLTVRVGQFLSPYGVWNVDHGSPVYIPIHRPWVIGEGWIPERQTGIELFGRAELGSVLSLGYHLTASNGIGPISEYSDLDENKAIGWRLFLELRSAGRLRLGFSGYYGRQTDATYSRTFDSDGTVVSEETLDTSFDTLTLAWDFTWEVGGLHLQSEWLLNQNAFTEEGRVQTEILGSGTAFPSDNIAWGGYGLIGYRFEWLGVMPFVEAEVADGQFHYYKASSWSMQAGLNIRPNDVVVLKASFEHLFFDIEGLPPFNAIWTQVAWSF